VRDTALAAMRAVIPRVILPRTNLLALRDLPRDLKRRTPFGPVDQLDDVLEAALEGGSGRRTLGGGRPPRGRAAAPAAARGR
jgi:ATP-dependent Lon protease